MRNKDSSGGVNRNSRTLPAIPRIFRRLLAFAASVPCLILASLAGTGFLFGSEDDFSSTLFAVLVTALVASLLFLLIRRLAASIYSAWILSALIAVVSSFKAHMTGMSLHSFDLVFLLGDSSAFVFLLYTYFSQALIVLTALGGALCAVFLITRVEKPRQIRLAWRAAAPVALFFLTAQTLPGWAAGTDYYYYGRHVSAFAASIRDLAHLWQPHPLAARLASVPPQTPYRQAFQCMEGKRPDIILLHAESEVPPGDLKTWGIDNDLIGDFRSSDGRVHRLGVETFGGSSWVTIASVMTGLSGADFEWMRPFIMKTVRGTVGATLPEIAKTCGYRVDTVIGYDLFDIGSFMAANGARNDMTAADGHPGPSVPRDGYYLDAGRKILARNRAEDVPSFVYIETMFAHSPYDMRYEAATTLPGEPFSENAETNEYLRRLAMSRQDIAALKRELAADPGKNGTIVVEYGDHRPLVALNASGSVDDLSDLRSPAYETYFAANSFGAAPVITPPEDPRMDAAFLGYWVVKAAGIAQGGLVDDMAELQQACGGLFHLCPDRARVDRLLKRRVQSGLLSLPPLIDQWRPS